MYFHIYCCGKYIFRKIFFMKVYISVTSCVSDISLLDPCVLSMPLKLLAEWIDLAQNRDSWRALVNEERNICLP